MSDETRDLMGRMMGGSLSRRRLMGTGSAAIGAAVLAGGSMASVMAAPATSGGRTVIAQDGGFEFHGAYPYLDPSSGGHFNTFVTDGILPPTGTVYGEMISAPLGMYFWADDEWLPLLATEWGFIVSDTFAASDSGTPSAVAATPVTDEANTFEVKLREGVIWSDDTPFTAADVVDTLWTAKILSNTLWKYIDDVVAVDDYTVHAHLAVPSTVVERYIIRSLPPRPSAVFGEWAEQARQVFGVQGLTVDDPEGAQLLEQFNQFRPELPPATGPYMIDEASITNAQMTLVKNEKSWIAENALFDRIINFNGETDTISAVVLSGDVDYATHGFAPATEQEMLANGIRVLRPPVYSGPALLMNFGKFPEVFGDYRVRQALAYALDGDQIGFFSLAESGVPVQYYTGFSDNLVPTWLSDDFLATLNTYETNLETAASMLEEAGWTKDGDKWKTPAGDDAAFELSFPAEFADWSAAGQALADQLNTFGFTIEPRAVTYTQHPIDVDKGEFDLAIRGWGSSNNPHPHFAFTEAFFTNNTLAINNGGEGIAFPLEQEVDGETVDLNELVVNSALGLDVEAQKADVETMTTVYNELLPKIPLFERYGNNAGLEGVRVAAWPADDDPILKNSPYADAIPAMLIYQGLLKPFEG